MKAKQKLIIAITSLLIAVITLATVSFAWFATKEKTDAFLMVSGNSNLSAEVYFGKDSNKDGNLDLMLGDDGLPLVLSRGDNIASNYLVATKKEVNLHTQCIPGTSITYKVVIYNESDKSSTFQFFVSNMEDYFLTYFDEYLENADLSIENSVGAFPTDTTFTENMKTLLGVNSARLMFLIENLNVESYARLNDAGINDFTNGFINKVATSIESDAIDGITQITNLNSLTSISATQYSYNLWQMGAQQPIIDMVIDANTLMEINFKLTCVQSESIGTGYLNYAQSNYFEMVQKRLEKYLEDNSLTASDAQKTSLVNGYIEDMVDEELSYLVSQFTGKQLSFNIDRLIITGKQNA